MKQVIRRVIDRKGVIALEELPTPACGDDQVLISTHYSLISSGTETATVVKTPSELVKQTIQDPWMRNAVKNLVTSGDLKQTADTIMNELGLYRLIGYSGSGIVLKKGGNVTGVDVGDRVAYAAQGHAEQVSASANLVVKVPDALDLKHAAFVTVGGIALQGVRRAHVEIGHWVVVYGLGLVGQITAQILQASGARVIGIDVSESRIELARQSGLQHAINAAQENVVESVMRITSAKGADRCVICAFSKEPEIANNALKLTRKQGRVVFVGLVKMDLERKPFFENELDLAFSRAYGPGSYDSAYEKGRIDYPYQYIRWTEERNLEEVLRLCAEGRIDFEPLIDAVYPMEEAQGAFDAIRNGTMKSVACLIAYPQTTAIQSRVDVAPKRHSVTADTINVGIIGTGNFTRNYHIPNLARHKHFQLHALCSATGLNAGNLAKKHKVKYLSSNYKELLADDAIDLILVATRHNLHAQIIVEALNAGKHVFAEKPVALKAEELEQVREATQNAAGHLFIGYNRRHAATTRKLHGLLSKRPLMIRYAVNIQHLPDSHWTLDPVEGGGRLLGEADHFFDTMNYLADSRPVAVQAQSFPVDEDTNDGLFNFMVQVRYENNSLGQLIYSSLGGPKFPRERVEVFSGGQYFVLDDYKRLSVNGKRVMRKADIGHAAELESLYALLSGNEQSKREDLLDPAWMCIEAAGAASPEAS